MNKAIEARRAVYRWLYERRIDSPFVYFPQDDLTAAAAEPYLGAALSFGLEFGHLEKKRGHWRLTALGMLHAEQAEYVEGEN